MSRYMVDFHGVIDQKPKFFRKFLNDLIKTNNTVIICSGAREEILKEKLKKLQFEVGVHYSSIISITDYFEKVLPENEIEYDNERNIWVDEVTWWSSKAEFCKIYHIDIIIDDCEFYLMYVKPPTMKMLFKVTEKQ